MFSDLSTETLVDILSRVHYLRLVRCRRICRRLQLIVDQTPLLQFIIEVGAAGYKLDEFGGATQDAIVDRLNKFRDLQRVYRNPTPRLISKVNLKICGPSLSERDWFYERHVFGDVLVLRTTDFKTLGVLSLRFDVPGQQRFCDLTFPFNVVDVHVNVARDLLILWTGWEGFRFKSFTTGETHPRLEPGCEACHTPDSGEPYNRNHFQWSVWGDWILVGTRIGLGGPAFATYLYHWPSCQLRKSWKPVSGANSRYPQSGSLADGFILIPDIHAESERPCINVFSLPNEKCKDVRFLVSYQFPEPSSESVLSIKALLPNTTYQTSEPAARMICLRLGLYPAQLYIPADVLLTETLRERAQHGMANTAVEVVDWPSWGKAHGRFIDPCSAGTPTAVTGMHLIYTTSIRDFNQYDLVHNIYGPTVAHGRRLRSTGAKYPGAIHEEPTSPTSYIGFHGDLSTALPYRVTDLETGKINWRDRAIFVERAEGLMYVKVLSTGEHTPKAMHFFSVTA